MRIRWNPVLLVVISAVGIIAYKWHKSQAAPRQATQRASASNPQVILVANLGEADEPGDNCAEIIHLVRDAGAHGLKVQELSPDSSSPLLKRYRVLTVPTLLVLDPDGKVLSRYEGETSSTVQQIRERLANLSETQR